MKLLIVTGMSGAGKTRILNALEDIGWYCIDNLPPGLLADFIDFQPQMGESATNVAITIDSRSISLAASFTDILDILALKKVDHSILFIDCEDSVLLRRYKESRRNHPLMYHDPNLALSEAIAKERLLLTDLRFRSDYILDSTHTSVAELKIKIADLFGNNQGSSFIINFISFGFKYGSLNEADLIFDLRCLPNPFYQEDLRLLTGEQPAVVDFLWSYPETTALYQSIVNYLDLTIPLYYKEGKTQLNVGLGCTGGKHRSVAFARRLFDQYLSSQLSIRVYHRDIKRD